MPRVTTKRSKAWGTGSGKALDRQPRSKQWRKDRQARRKERKLVGQFVGERGGV